jgi:hypothetical protein
MDRRELLKLGLVIPFAGIIPRRKSGHFWLQTRGVRDDVDPEWFRNISRIIGVHSGGTIKGNRARDYNIGALLQVDARTYKCFQMDSTVFRKNDGIYLL